MESRGSFLFHRPPDGRKRNVADRRNLQLEPALGLTTVGPEPTEAPAPAESRPQSVELSFSNTSSSS